MRPRGRSSSCVAIRGRLGAHAQRWSLGVRSITRADGWAQERDFDFWPPPWDHRRMELRHLRTIAAVARHGSFTKAAEELYLAQSAIAVDRRRLDPQLGVQG